MARLAGIWCSLAVALAGGRDVCLESDDVVVHVSLLQKRAELLSVQVPGDVVSRIADQDLFGKHEVVHPHRAQMRLHRAMRQARSGKSSPIGDRHLLKEIMEDSKDLKSTKQTDSGDDSAFRVLEGETTEQEGDKARKEGHKRADDQSGPHKKASSASARDEFLAKSGSDVVEEPQDEDELLAAARSDIIEGPQDEVKYDISQCTSYMGKKGCGWTSEWSCPDQRSGSKGEARDSKYPGQNSLGYNCCCAHGLWAVDTVAGKLHVLKATGKHDGLRAVDATAGNKHGATTDSKLVATRAKGNEKKASKAKSREEVKHVSKDKIASKVERREEAKHASKHNKASTVERREEVKHANKDNKESKVERREAKHASKDKKDAKVERSEEVKHASKDKVASKVERREEVKHASEDKKEAKVETRAGIKHASKDKKASKVKSKGKKTSKGEGRELVKHASNDKKESQGKHVDEDSKAPKGQRREKVKPVDRKKAFTIVRP